MLKASKTSQQGLLRREEKCSLGRIGIFDHLVMQGGGGGNSAMIVGGAALVGGGAYYAFSHGMFDSG